METTEVLSGVKNIGMSGVSCCRRSFSYEHWTSEGLELKCPLISTPENSMIDEIWNFVFLSIGGSKYSPEALVKCTHETDRSKLWFQTPFNLHWDSLVAWPKQTLILILMHHVHSMQECLVWIMCPSLGHAWNVSRLIAFEILIEYKSRAGLTLWLWTTSSATY